MNTSTSARGAGLFTRLALLFFTIILVTLAFPNEFIRQGLGFLGWIALAPLVPLFTGVKVRYLPLYGAVYGYFLSALATFWLGTYHPVALVVVASVNAVWFALAFFLQGLLARRLGRWFFLAGPIVWLAIEYLRTLGFLGNPYLIMGYTQYAFMPALGLSSLGGIWLPGLIVLIPSWLLGTHFSLVPGKLCLRPTYNRCDSARLVCTLGVIGGLLILGSGLQKDYQGAPELKLALIQHNRDPWEGGIAAYTKNFGVLSRLSRQAMEENPDMIVWSETAFVPPIEYHLRYREVPESEALVRDLLEFLPTLGVPVLFGQNHAERRIGPGGEKIRDNYNAALLYDKGFTGRYDKMHLVPFTEYFPYGDILPGVKQWLVANKSIFWMPGLQRTLFRAAGVNFSTPICFEDSFGPISRDFVNDGAEILITLSNDTWSGSVTAMMQHLAMATFRSAETGRAQVRAANGGMTVSIDPNGAITAMLEPFTEGILHAKVPVLREGRTLYLDWGDWFAQLVLIGSGILLLSAVVLGRISTVDSNGKKEQYRKQREQP